MSARVHFLATDEPKKSGKELEALCGAQVQNAQFAFMWDELAMGNMTIGASMNEQGFFNLCTKCRKSSGSIDKRYVYGIYNGQEARDAESRQA